ncbi:MAG: TolC family protein, partial [Xanthomonadales bacterium]|nr:TolC family protein [Xanthomonadales bacterium]
APENVHVGGLTLALTQPLLRNFGGRITEAGIRIARKNVVIAEHQFRQKVNDTIGQVVIAYHQLVYRIEDLKAKEDDLGRARQ